ncbi:hypothetical protein [Shewanella sp.]|uniref:hypothetical protein n=1 Tax=Shewanella sp. TaxID=50422 RepID=UPI0026216CB9|nr:hypothetical protein [Shewanella sp.]
MWITTSQKFGILKSNPDGIKKVGCPSLNLGGGTLLLIADHSPSALGRMGQVIAYTHDPDMMDFISTDLSQLFEQSLAQIALYPDELIED